MDPLEAGIRNTGPAFEDGPMEDEAKGNRAEVSGWTDGRIAIVSGTLPPLVVGSDAAPDGKSPECWISR